MEVKIETVSEAIKLMFFIYGLAAVVSLAVAGVIKLIFAGVKWRRARADARSKAAADAASDTPGEPGDAAPEGAD